MLSEKKEGKNETLQKTVDGEVFGPRKVRRGKFSELLNFLIQSGIQKNLDN